jgi:hypothetical protein
MAAKVEFQDFSIQVKDAIEDAAVQFLEEASSELESQAARNSAFSKNLHGTWNHVVNESKMEATVGNPMELAIWMELGTGEYALEGKGRKGYWVYVKGNNSVKESNPGKARTLEEAKMAVAILREQGLEAYYTKGQKPKRMLHNAFTSKKAAIIRRAEQVFKGRLN